MTGAIISVRGEHHETVDPDEAQLHAVISITEDSKTAALATAATALVQLLAGLAELGGAARTPETQRARLTWSAQSVTTYVEQDKDRETGRQEPTGRVIATVAVVLTVRDFALLDPLGPLLADQAGLDVHQVLWSADVDNPAWPGVRAGAIHAAIRKGQDYAAALGGSIDRVEHIADAGLLGGADHVSRTSDWVALSASGQAGTPAMDPVPQVLSATIDARLVATDVTLEEVRP
ncbi:MAG: uncharacterized protein QOE24_2404 [Frankiales bacterium]|nr:uncharacterized protein [Frankiales bacterium]